MCRFVYELDYIVGPQLDQTTHFSRNYWHCYAQTIQTLKNKTILLLNSQC